MENISICGISLRKIQLEQLKILKEFDNICRENHLKYSIEGGTLLGAYKYEGFVPWDDDIDVVMLRDDYEKFLNIASQLNNGYSVHTYHSDSNFLLNYCKFRKNGTIYKEKLYRNKNMNHGLFIDIFPLDKTYLDKYLGQCKKIQFAFKLRWYKLGYRKKNIIFDLGLMMISNKFLIKRTEKLVNKYNKDQNADYVYEVCNSNSKFKPIPLNWFNNIIDLNFEGLKVMAVSNYKEYILSRFGDVSGLPPIEERKPSHQIVEVKL